MSLNAIAAARFYADKVISDPRIGGMKVLLLDATTSQVLAMVYSQTQILEKEVYLVERLDVRHERMPHLKAACFIQPTRENVSALKTELADPMYSEYHIFFSNIVPPDILQQLADADEHEVIRQVQEYYADYLAINEDLFTVNLRHLAHLSFPRPPEGGSAPLMAKNVRAVLSLLLSLKRKPSQIRYATSSAPARQLAAEVAGAIQSDGIFEFRRHEGPLLLILDRKDDPVTPLLSQWTYQAMVHELLGLNNNRVILKGAPGIKQELEEVVLSGTQDDFFARNRYANFGDLGAAVKGLMEQYQKATKLNEKITSIEDMQSFLERYPAFRSQAINVSKHVAVLSELARLVDVYHLLDVSQFEQELACDDDHGAHYKELLEKLASAKYKAPDKVRLAMLYALRYQEGGNLRQLKSKMFDAGLSADRVDLLDTLLQYAGVANRGPGLYGQKDMLAKIGKSITTTLQGVENVYAQHVPLLMSTIEAAYKGKLKDQVHPVLGQVSAFRPTEIVVYMLGGTTYEEAAKVAEYNTLTPGTCAVLGGSYVHNSTSFLEELSTAQRELNPYR